MMVVLSRLNSSHSRLLLLVVLYIQVVHIQVQFTGSSYTRIIYYFPRRIKWPLVRSLFPTIIFTYEPHSLKAQL